MKAGPLAGVLLLLDDFSLVVAFIGKGDDSDGDNGGSDGLDALVMATRYCTPTMLVVRTRRGCGEQPDK